MKIRNDFVTNSSSSSYIVCFARIANKEKAQKIIDEISENAEIYTAEEALEEIEAHQHRFNSWLDCDWAGVYDMTPEKEYIEQYKNDSFIVIQDCDELYEDEDGEVNYDVDYDDFSVSKYIDKVTEENGFAEIEIGYGAGRDG